MSFLTRKQALRVALESAAGTYASPDTDILWINPSVRPIEGTVVERNVTLPYLDPLSSLRTGDHAMIEFEVELAGAGTGGDAPPWAPLLMACGFAETSRNLVVAGGNTATVPGADKSVLHLSIGSSTDDAYTGRVFEFSGQRRIVSSYHILSDNTKELILATPLDPGYTSPGPYSIRADRRYSPISEFGADSSLTMEYFQGAEGSTDAVKFTFVKCRGTVVPTLNRQQIPTLKFTFTGLLHARSDDTMPDFDYSAWQEPLIPSFDNTPTFSLHGYSEMFVASLSVDTGNTVAYTQLLNAENVRITGRAPKGQIQFESLALGDQDFYDAIHNSTSGRMFVQHGNSPGNIVVFYAPGTQLQNAQYQEVDGILHVQSDLKFHAVAAGGNDSLQFIVA